MRLWSPASFLPRASSSAFFAWVYFVINYIADIYFGCCRSGHRLHCVILLALLSPQNGGSMESLCGLWWVVALAFVVVMPLTLWLPF